jgi:hypothetical protein
MPTPVAYIIRAHLLSGFDLVLPMEGTDKRSEDWRRKNWKFYFPSASLLP